MAGGHGRAGQHQTGQPGIYLGVLDSSLESYEVILRLAELPSQLVNKTVSLLHVTLEVLHPVVQPPHLRRHRFSELVELSGEGNHDSVLQSLNSGVEAILEVPPGKC